MHDRRVAAGDWSLLFRRRLYDWEEREVSRLKELLISGSNCCDNLEDKPVWLAAGSGMFSISSVYRSEAVSLGPSFFTSKLVWNNLAPPKVQFFCWLAWKNRVKSADFLQKIGVLQASSPALCAFCKSVAESNCHVLLYCQFSWRVWTAMLNWWEVQGALPGSVEAVLHWWEGAKLSKKEKLLWKVIKDQPLEEEQLKGIFKKHDQNGDGRLSRKELKKAFEELGAWIPDWRAWRGLSNADANGDGFISEEEMNSLVSYAKQFGFTVK
ncbi:hypothetical protein ACSBR1_000488 [Camellia fascicularis]